MTERGSDKHSARLDDEMKHAAQNLTRDGHPDHVEDGRETEPFPDSTDGPEVQEAIGLTPELEDEA